LSFDFTLDKYRQLCEAIINAQYTVLTVEACLTRRNPPQKFIVLRHDVDRNPDRALQMAIIENRFGIKASYYFRYDKKVFQPYIVSEIAKLGHEIGYHYETLDRAKGNYDKAIQMFEHELEEFRKIAEIKTICMHGNPLTKWDNRDLWTKYDFKNFGLIGEAYLSFDNITYLSDTGRTWGSKYKVKDWLPSITSGDKEKSGDNVVDSTDDLVHLIDSGHLKSVYLLAHPERWSNSLIGWITSLMLDTGVNLAKQMLTLRKRRSG